MTSRSECECVVTRHFIIFGAHFVNLRIVECQKTMVM